MKNLWVLVTVAFVTGTAGAQSATPFCEFPQRTLAQRVLHGEPLADPRPPTTMQVASPTLPLVVHYEAAVSEAYAHEILGYAETVWHAEFDRLGFRRPYSDGDQGGDDRFDLYIVTTLPQGVGGYTGFSGYNDATPEADAVGYVVIANEIDPRIRRFVVAHELFHASQMAYDWWEDMAFMEGSATWIVDHVFDDENIYWRYFPYFNAEPFKALDYISMMSPYQYGAGMFSLFLDERYGTGDGTVLRQIWEHTPQTAMDNEPDFLDATLALLRARDGSTTDDALREFGVWRLLVGSRAAYGRFSEVDLWDARVDPYLEVDMPPGVRVAEGEAAVPLQPLSHAFLRFARPAAEALPLTLEVYVDGATRMAVDWVEIGPAGVAATRGGVLEAHTTQTFVVPPAASRTELIFVITNLADAAHDTDTSPWTGTRFQYRFTAPR